ncbi:acyl-CoA N-acyltransferase, partial [Wolfiporia cocos MD-104 SS10]
YSERFYYNVLLPEVEDFCKLIYHNDIPVGTICCQLETVDGHTRLYLMVTMGVLAAYRSRGIGSQSLEQVITVAVAHSKPKINSIYLHVQVSNADTRKFYERHGFKETGVREGYYKIVPHDAWIFEKQLSGAANAPN